MVRKARRSSSSKAILGLRTRCASESCAEVEHPRPPSAARSRISGRQPIKRRQRLIQGVDDLPIRCPCPLVTVPTHAPAHPLIVRGRGSIAGAGGFRLLRGCHPSLTSSAPADGEAYAVPGASFRIRYAADTSQPADRTAKPRDATADRRSAGAGARNAATRCRTVPPGQIGPGRLPTVGARSASVRSPARRTRRVLRRRGSPGRADRATRRTPVPRTCNLIWSNICLLAPRRTEGLGPAREVRSRYGREGRRTVVPRRPVPVLVSPP